jgi:hypothetical protein
MTPFFGASKHRRSTNDLKDRSSADYLRAKFMFEFVLAALALSSACIFLAHAVDAYLT